MSKLVQILDDNAQDFKYAGGQWTLSTLVQWYQQTSNYPAFASGSTLGSFTLSFQGTSIAFIGNTPSSDHSQTATVSIDGGTPYTITYPGTPPSYIQWYQSPTLSEGTHTITVGKLDGTAVDYALIEVGQNTPLSGKSIAVDDDDSAMVYSGSWKRSTAEFDAGSLPDGFPLHNTTHRSSTAGDTVTFRFSGTSYAVYGIFSWENLGLLAATYTLDGSTTAQSYPVTTSSGQYIKGDKEAVNLLYFSEDNLSSGDHTLVINITQSQNVQFMLDYITYTPSFLTLAAMPKLSNSGSVTTSVSAGSTGTISTAARSSGSGSSSPSSILSGSISGSISGSTAIGRSTAPASGVQGSQGSQTSNSKSTPVGAIVGGVLGAIFLLGIFGLLFVWLQKRRPAESRLVGPSNSDNHPPYQPAETRQSQPYTPYRDEPGQISPFQTSPYDSSGQFGSINDLKRERFAPSPSTMQRTGSPFHPPSSPSVALGSNAASSPSEDLEYSSNRPTSVPPAYDALVPLRSPAHS